MGDELGQQRVVSVRDEVALAHAGLDPDAVPASEAAAGARWRAGSRRPDPRRRDAPRSRDRSSARSAWAKPERLAGGDPQLVGDEVAARHRLGDRMLDLEAGVHLEEEEVAAIGHQELDGAGADVADRGRDLQRGRSQPLAQRAGVTDGPGDSSMIFWLRRWDEQSRSPRWTPCAVRVEEDLHLDVARPLEQPLEDEPIVPERAARLATAPMPARRPAAWARGRPASPCHRHRRTA